MNDKFLKPYNSVEAEEHIPKLWEESGFFNPDNLPAGQTSANGSPRFTEPFSIVLPPPNVTGILHMGSAFMLAIEDIMVRYARMTGKKTLWIPGTDHAAIATQAKVESIIYKEEGKRRHDLGREELLRRIDIFAKESHDTIVTQIKKMGCSIDWSREAFTLDEKRNLAVRTAFKKMYDDGIIYRGNRIINWDVKGQTTISDDEIIYTEQKGKLYTFKYSKDFPISIATTRPETKVGDVAVAVHPDDVRYKQYVGKTYNATFAGASISIKVIADDAVDPEFGTGAVGVTPCHSMTDWDIAERHNSNQASDANAPLRKDIIVINEVGKMTEAAGPMLAGKKVADARATVVEWLIAEGLLKKNKAGEFDGEDITQNIATAERTGGVIEPLPKLQWFVAVNKKFIAKIGPLAGKETTLKELMLSAVKANFGEIDIIPERFERVYLNWIANLRDWCISRQIWYGHRVPVWYRSSEIYCGVDTPKGGDADGWKQDEDTLDTWFSSGLWTFSTLGWPDEKEFAKHRMYHPTTILETGRDIIFFWVARMILMSTYLLGEIPFKTVYMHGLVLDNKGQKISKSLGNNIDPLDMIAKYGADAVRMSLVVGTGPGNDSKISEDKIKGYRNFANKLWNITRFVLTSTTGVDGATNISLDPQATFTGADKNIFDEWRALLAEITAEMDTYRFYLVAEKLYHYAWHNFADVILEDSKKILATPGEAADSRKQLLLTILNELVTALHPFIPFVTEEIWSHMADVSNTSNVSKNNLLLIEKWPGK